MAPTMKNRISGLIDELAVWNRNLSPSEIKQVYRRAANRIWFQVRSCDNANCSDGVWKGNASGSSSFFSELQNTTTGGTIAPSKLTSPKMVFADYIGTGLVVDSKRYFQYKIILESDDRNELCTYGGVAENCSPELTSVTVLPNHYRSVAFAFNVPVASFYSLSSFSINYGAAGCPMGSRFLLNNNLSVGKYYNGTTWLETDNTLAGASTISQLNSGAATFGSTVGRGSLYMIGGYLLTDGPSPCEIDTITINGNNSFN